MWLFCIYNCDVVCIEKTTDQQKQVITEPSNKGYKQFLSGTKYASPDAKKKSDATSYLKVLR